jgi:hypothetical protein
MYMILLHVLSMIVGCDAIWTIINNKASNASLPTRICPFLFLAEKATDEIYTSSKERDNKLMEAARTGQTALVEALRPLFFVFGY